MIWTDYFQELTDTLRLYVTIKRVNFPISMIEWYGVTNQNESTIERYTIATLALQIKWLQSDGMKSNPQQIEYKLTFDFKKKR